MNTEYKTFTRRIVMDFQNKDTEIFMMSYQTLSLTKEQTNGWEWAAPPTINVHPFPHNMELAVAYITGILKKIS